MAADFANDFAHPSRSGLIFVSERKNMKIVFHVVAAVAVVGLPFGIYALFYQPAVGGPILLSSAVYLGLFSIACRTKGKEPNG